MRRALFLIISVFFLSTQILFAQNKTEKFMAKGSCGMCEVRIEKAAMSVAGVSMAEWNMKSKSLTVTYDASKTNIKTIQKAVAKAGHDTDLYKADDKTYNKLPACCKYRKKMCSKCNMDKTNCKCDDMKMDCHHCGKENKCKCK